VTPTGIKIDVMPQALGRQLQVVDEYSYAKTASDILVIDPMSMNTVAVIPRRSPADARTNAMTPAEWWNSHASELTGNRSGAPRKAAMCPSPRAKLPPSVTGRPRTRSQPRRHTEPTRQTALLRRRHSSLQRTCSDSYSLQPLRAPTVQGAGQRCSRRADLCKLARHPGPP
jgi:hypothetical protein